MEIPILRKDGDIRLALWNSANIYREDGVTLMATIAQGTDITERVERERKMEQMNADLQAFAHTLSHDLKAPLSNAYGYSSTLKFLLAGKLDGREADALEVTIHSLESMDRIIDGMLQYASLEKPEELIRGGRAWTRCSRILEELRESGLLGENCRLEIAPLPIVTGDPARLRQGVL